MFNLRQTFTNAILKRCEKVSRTMMKVVHGSPISKSLADGMLHDQILNREDDSLEEAWIAILESILIVNSIVRPRESKSRTTLCPLDLHSPDPSIFTAARIGEVEKSVPIFMVIPMRECGAITKTLPGESIAFMLEHNTRAR
jgi:hypothetical protein